jgi:hypothetical protein
MHRQNTTELRQSLTRSDRYRLVYENAGVAIYRVDGSS